MNSTAKSILLRYIDDQKTHGNGYIAEALKLEEEARGYRKRAMEHFSEASEMLNAVAEIQNAESEELSRRYAKVA